MRSRHMNDVQTSKKTSCCCLFACPLHEARTASGRGALLRLESVIDFNSRCLLDSALGWAMLGMHCPRIFRPNRPNLHVTGPARPPRRWPRPGRGRRSLLTTPPTGPGGLGGVGARARVAMRAPSCGGPRHPPGRPAGRTGVRRVERPAGPPVWPAGGALPIAHDFSAPTCT